MNATAHKALTGHPQTLTNVKPKRSTMNSLKNVCGILLTLVALTLCGELAATPASISSFPYNPSDSQEADDFEANYGLGPTTSGSTWTHGSVSSPREGSSGSGSNAWAVLPTSNYANDTVTWLHSPIFNFGGQSGLEMKFEMWMRCRYDIHGMKLQVSSNGGSSWEDVTTLSIAYNDGVGLIGSTFGGAEDCWSGNDERWSGDAHTCILNLNPWAGEDDVRFRWCFVAGDSEGATLEGPVIDSVRINAVTSTIAYSSGYAALPQNSVVSTTVTKTSGDPFVGGMTVEVQGTGVSGTVTSVASSNQCTVQFTTTRTADVGEHIFWIKDGSTKICQGAVQVYYPQQLVPAREVGTSQEPPRNGAVGGNGVYL